MISDTDDDFAAWVAYRKAAGEGVGGKREHGESRRAKKVKGGDQTLNGINRRSRLRSL